MILNASTPKTLPEKKKQKRQRSNPGTPVSTPRRMPYDYDAVMGITRVGTREAEGFDEDLDSTEYHDANDTTEEPIRKEETETDSCEHLISLFWPYLANLTRK